MKKIFIFLVTLSFLAVPLNVFAGGPINVASKGFTEQVILGKIMATLLQDRGIPVKDRTSLGGPMSAAKLWNRARLMYTWNILELRG